MCVGRLRKASRVLGTLGLLGLVLGHTTPASAQTAPNAPAPPPAAPAPTVAAPVVPPTTAAPAQTAATPVAPPPTTAAPAQTAATPVAPPPTTAAPAPAVVAPSAAPAAARESAAGKRELRCAGRCVRLFEEGSYRVWIDSTERLSGGATNVTIRSPGVYLAEGVERSRRAPGLALGAAGIVLAGVGAGMAIGGGAFRSGLTSSQETWFWAGMFTFGIGVTLVPLGFKMYSRSPRMTPLALSPNGVPLASSAEPLPRRYREALLVDGRGAPQATGVIEEPRWGLLSAGAITFASSYGIMAAIAAGYAADGTHPGRYAAALIPIFGPTLLDRRSGDGPVLTIFGTIPELTGAILMLLGASGTRRFAVQSEPALSVAPLLGPNTNGLALRGAF